MAYIIHINGIDYLITDYSAWRMLQRHISDEIVIETIQKGDLIEQAHERDILEAQIWDDRENRMRTIRVIIEPTIKTVITVYDDSDINHE